MSTERAASETNGHVTVQNMYIAFEHRIHFVCLAAYLHVEKHVVQYFAYITLSSGCTQANMQISRSCGRYSSIGVHHDLFL